MLRLLGLLFLLSAAVYGEGFGFCNCPPTLAVFVNATNYSDNFVTTTEDGQTFFISGSVVTPTFSFALNATTKQDTDIDFETSIFGDPTVAFIITQSFLTQLTSFQLDTFSHGIIRDLSGDGAASALGTPFLQQTLVDGVVVDNLNTGCNITAFPPSAVDGLPCPSTVRDSQIVTLPPPDPFFPGLHTLQLRVGFSLSDGDQYLLDGGTTLAPTPEPGTIVPMVAGLIALGGAAWRKRRRA